ncbi:MAG: hypothetical protein JKY66_06985 [Spongiibacteraceae bacterium]|nr:hypothetical protein [Spongiibacteraceae bacterium]
MSKTIFLLVLLLGVIACSETDSNVKTTVKGQPLVQPEESLPQVLDLSIEHLPVSDTDEDIDYSTTKHNLSSVFEKSKKEKQSTVSAGVLRQEENEDYLDSINGAEVSVEIKIP